jgi:hypothetical protein
MNEEATNLCQQSPISSGPYGIAISELESARIMSSGNHDVAIREGRYDDAKHFNDRVKSLCKAIHLLAAADFVHTTK